jgi:hypothetical protein
MGVIRCAMLLKRMKSKGKGLVLLKKRIIISFGRTSSNGTKGGGHSS